MSGIYIHIPFCKQKCSYCDFHFSTTFQSYRDSLVQTLQNELIQRVPYLKGEVIESIYFGGGTPSLLTPEELSSLFETIHENYDVLPTAEITLEANPDDISLESIQHWKSSGINRLSIGIQSFKESDLKWMNRAHTVSEAMECVKLAKDNGIETISVDLIYGLPGLTLDEWKDHIELVLKMGVQHISAYCLTVEEKTVLHQLVKTKKLIPAGEDDQSDQFLLLTKLLKEAGFIHYEISNFGIPGFEAVHNSNYWKGKTYLGIGPSAHSFNGRSRRWNISNNSNYIKHFGDTKSWYQEEQLSKKDMWNELMLTGLRTSYGVDLNKLKELSSFSKSFLRKLEKFEKNGWLENNTQTIVLTEQGRLMADHIASELFLD